MPTSLNCLAVAGVLAAISVLFPPAWANCVSQCYRVCRDDDEGCKRWNAGCLSRCESGQFRSDRFGAIAYSPSTGAFGHAHEHETQENAERRATAECGKDDCKVTTWFKNGACGALATNGQGAYGLSWGNSRSEAAAKSLAQCGTAGCKIQLQTCSR